MDIYNATRLNELCYKFELRAQEACFQAQDRLVSQMLKGLPRNFSPEGGESQSYFREETQSGLDNSDRRE